MNTINESLPLFKNMQQPIVADTSNYENIKPKQKYPLSRIDVQSSKSFLKNNIFLLLIIFFLDNRIIQKFIKK